eukprot:140490_1
MTYVLLCVLFCPHMSNGNTINCNNTHQCVDNTLQCVQDEDCYINCIGDDVCHSRTIICPYDASYICYVFCSGIDACFNSTIVNVSDAVCNEESCGNSLIQFNNNSNSSIYVNTMSCLGDYACFMSIISHVTHIVCNSKYGCENSTIICNKKQNCSVECLGSLSCRYSMVLCPSNPRYDCTIKCFGSGSCRYAELKNVVTVNATNIEQGEIYCRNNDDNCNIYCGKRASCKKATIFGGDGTDLFIFTTPTEAVHAQLQLANVYCGSNAFCNITCDGWWNGYSGSACHRANFYSDIGTKMFIVAKGEMPLQMASIRCPDSMNCHIYGYNVTEMLYEAQIYATHPFKLKCNDNTDCFADVTNRRPRFYCNDTAYCMLTSSLLGATDWKCVQDESFNAICNEILTRTLNPTGMPTTTPTTAIPTFSPTYAFDENKIIYLSKTGCDHGRCNSPYANYSQYCSNDDFIYNSQYSSIHNQCCPYLSYREYETPLQITISIPSECDEFGIMTIDGTHETYEHHLAANTFLDVLVLEGNYEKYPSKALCFQVDKDYQCNDPIVTVFFENIWYANGPTLESEQYLNVSYMDKHNYISQKCWGGIMNGHNAASCGNWLECPVFVDTNLNNQPPDEIWRYRDGIKVFYFTNGQGVWSYCKDGKERKNVDAFNMNISLSVTCNGSYFGHSTCNSVNYGWNCLNGNNIYCADYNGNGQIKIGQGIFNFNQTIESYHNNIVITGDGMNETVLNYIGDHAEIIICVWIQCFITIRDLQYTSSIAKTDFIIIKVSNGGNLKFQSVLFQFNHSQNVLFQFNQSQNVLYVNQIEFTNCIFANIHNLTFNITHLNKVTFNNCSFSKNKLVFEINDNSITTMQNTSFMDNVGDTNTSKIYSMFNVVDDSNLHIVDCIYNGNKHFYSLINNDNSSIIIQSSLFIKNYYINHILASKTISNSKVLETQIFTDNICQTHCISILNGNLYIDSYSLTFTIPYQTLISAPTKTPTYIPTIETSKLVPLCSSKPKPNFLLSSWSYSTIQYHRGQNVYEDGIWKQIDVDLLDIFSINAVGIWSIYFHKNAPDAPGRYVTSYNLLYSLNGVNFTDYNINNPLAGNTANYYNGWLRDRNIFDYESRTYFNPPLSARYVRFFPLTVSIDNQKPWITWKVEIYSREKKTLNPTTKPTLYPTTEPTIEPVLWQTFDPTLEPTLNPLEEPTVEPTIDPTLNPSIYNKNEKILVFGHTLSHNDTHIGYNILQIENISPQIVDDKIDFIHWGHLNGTIIFEPCVPFDSEYVNITEFEHISRALNATVTNSFTQSGQFYDSHLFCDDEYMCYIECTENVLTCINSVFISNISMTTLINCNSKSSCANNLISISGSETAALLCSDESSCKQSVVYVDNINQFILECGKLNACFGLRISIKNTNNATIKCYSSNACQSLLVWTDQNNINMYMHSWNENILVEIPSNYTQVNLVCNPNNAYLSLYGPEWIQSNATVILNDVKKKQIDLFLEKQAKELFGGGMPCENIKFLFHNTDKVDCDIRYEFFSKNDTHKQLEYLKRKMKCFPPIYIKSFTEYKCFGTNAPTTNPTSNPTTDPTLDPTINPTTSPTQNLSCVLGYNLDIAFLVDDSCGLTQTECKQEKEGISELLASIKRYNNPRFMYLKFSNYTQQMISLNDIVYNNLGIGGESTAENNFFNLLTTIRNDPCKSDKTYTNLTDAIVTSLQQFDTNSGRQMKLVIFSNCQSKDIIDPCSLHVYLKAKQVEPMVINIISENSDIDDIISENAYLKCLTNNDNKRYYGLSEPYSLLSPIVISEFHHQVCDQPTSSPTIDPTIDPTNHPTTYPTTNPTTNPTNNPTAKPTTNPTHDPTINPTTDPSNNPTTHPTMNPTNNPTQSPSNAPSIAPTFSPTIKDCVSVHFGSTKFIIQNFKINYTLKILGCNPKELGNGGKYFEFILNSKVLGVNNVSISIPIPTDNCYNCTYSGMFEEFIETNMQQNSHRNYEIYIKSNEVVNGYNIKIDTQSTVLIVTVCDINISFELKPKQFNPGQYVSITPNISLQSEECSNNINLINNHNNIPYSFKFILSSSLLQINNIVLIDKKTNTDPILCSICNSQSTDCFAGCNNLLPNVPKNSNDDDQKNQFQLHIASTTDNINNDALHVNTESVDLSASVCDVGYGSNNDSVINDCNLCLIDEVKFKKGTKPCYKCNSIGYGSNTIVSQENALCLGSYQLIIPYNHWTIAYNEKTQTYHKLSDINYTHTILTSRCPEGFCCSNIDGCEYLLSSNDNFTINPYLCALNRD